MPSLERFFNPSIRVFTQNLTSLPGARLYFFSAGTTTPKVTYQDKQGAVEHSNPVIADSSGVFPQIFLDGLYRVELRSSANLVQTGWPIDNVGQDYAIVPFAAWSEIVTYQEFEVVSDPLTGNWYRSLIDNNIGNDPTTTTGFWESLVSPVASNFESDAAWATFSSSAGKISLDIDVAGLVDDISDDGSGSATVDGITFTWNAATLNGKTFIGIKVNGTVATGGGSVVASALVGANFRPDSTQSCMVARQGADAGTVAPLTIATDGTVTLGLVSSGQEFTDKSTAAVY